MARQGVNEVLTGRLYQRGHFLSWPAADKAKLLDGLGIDVVVNLWHKMDADLSNDQGRIYIHLPMRSVQPGEAERVMVFAVHRLMASGRKVLVHCEAGRNRSAWFCAKLVERAEAVTPWEAWELVKERVPGASLRPELKKDLLG
jgi:protein-tyrosine phosphatase